ncbi:hypothetical protein GGI17_000937 [Coemansia sp. S146]|nr:hypothetical protein GGI17_000937 [Coemansia sp. S146]
MPPQRTNRSYTAAKYGLSIDVPQSTYDTEVDAQWRRQQSELVIWAAEWNFDNALGQCNWEAVASELDTPLIECLELFDASNSTIKPRLLIETYGGWSETDMDALKQFIAANYANGSTVDWKLAGAYMNVDALECRRVGKGAFKDPINKVCYRRICEFRDSGLDWKDIHQRFMQYPNITSLQSRYYGLKAELNGGTTNIGLTAEWTDAERKLMQNLIERHTESVTTSELADTIKRDLSARPLNDTRLFLDQYTYELKAGRISSDQMTQLRELVAEYGEDWGHIGKALCVLPSRAQHNWFLMVALRQQDDALSGSSWTVAEDEPLFNMVDGSTTSAAAKWEQANKALGRTAMACKQRFKGLNHKRKQVTGGRDSFVTSEVQRQLESSGAIAWPLVSQATGFGLRECFELNQYDIGKGSWHYGPDPFSKSMANRMTGFIKEHYPAPVPVSYRAVSNYMWVAMEDCIRIHDMLQGRFKFKWEEADYERAAALRAQGLRLKEVAQHLSPALTRKTVGDALNRYSSSKLVQEPISADELQEISRLVGEYAGTYTVVEIATKICTQLNLGNRFNCYGLISSRIGAHPHYLAKLRGIDRNDLANRIATGQTTVKLAAKELDVPYPSLMNSMRSLNSRQFSSAWTEVETRKLLDYMQTCDSKPDFVYFSKVLGTKSAKQCSARISNLKRKGVLPHTPTI